MFITAAVAEVHYTQAFALMHVFMSVHEPYVICIQNIHAVTNRL